MATAYTSLLGLALPVTGELSGTWGDTVNNSITSLLDTSVAGTTNVSTDADVTLTTTTGASNTARQAILLFSGARTVLRTVTAPAQSKIYTVINATTGGFSVKLVGAGPTTGVTIVAGESAICAWNGSDFVKVSNTGGAASFTNVTVTGTTTLSGLTASTALALDASKNVVSVTNTGSGSNVLATSPTLVTPALGTPSALVGTNITGTATSFNINGTVGATTPATGAFTTLTTSSTVTLSGGTANGVAYLNGSKVVTSGSALTFDGTNLATTGDISLGAGKLLKYSSTAYITPENNVSGAEISTTGVVTFLTGSGTPTERARIDSSGNFGIGTSSPAYKLQVSSGATAATSYFTSTATPAYSATAYNGGSARIALNGGGASGATTGINFSQGGSFELYLGGVQESGGAAAFVFQGYNGSAYVERMRLDASGNLGIGTSSPSAKLDVAGSVQIQSTGVFYLNNSDNTNQYYWQNIGATGANNATLILSRTNAGETLRVDSSGNVGIGTSSPSQKLDVAGNITATAWIGRANGSAPTADCAIYRAADNTLGFSTASTERVRITSDGNLLVGTTGGTYQFNTTVASGADRDMLIAGVNGVTNGFQINYINSGTALAVRFNSITTTASSANAFLDSADGNRIYRSTSSLRYKTNIENIEESRSNAVLNLRPVWYKSLAKDDKNEWSWYGLIAEEVAEVEPRLVHWSYLDSDYECTEENGQIKKTLKDGATLVPDGVQYERVSVLLLDVVKRQGLAIQEQKALIESLKARLDAANL